MWDTLIGRGLPSVEVPPAGVVDGSFDITESTTTDDLDLDLDSGGERDTESDSGGDGDIDSEADHKSESRRHTHRRRYHKGDRIFDNKKQSGKDSDADRDADSDADSDVGAGRDMDGESDRESDEKSDEDSDEEEDGKKDGGKKENEDDDKDESKEQKPDGSNASTRFTFQGPEAVRKLNQIFAVGDTEKEPSPDKDSGESESEDMTLENMEAWRTLDHMVGLEDIKERIRMLHRRAIDNRSRKKNGLTPRPIPHTGVFVGPSGTGKTTVARLYAQILHRLGFVKEDSVLELNASQIVGSSDPNTKLADSEGKVLIIDDAHGLWGGSKSDTDRWHRTAIDAIIARVSSSGSANVMVLLVGYEDEIQNMFDQVSPGLSTRFPLDSAFRFPGLSISQLERILEKRLESASIRASSDAKCAALAVLAHSMASPRFGNASEVDTLLHKAYFSMDKRCFDRPDADTTVLEPEDFSKDWKRHVDAEEECKKLFHDVVGCETVISELLDDTKIVRKAIARGIDPKDYISFNYIFRGDPGMSYHSLKPAHFDRTLGTGKTSTARKMGQVFYHMGLLASDEVIECSVSDIIGEYVGHTGPKIIRLLKRAIGKVLLIDEAYRLNDGLKSDNSFSRDAVAEIVGALTSPMFQQKMVIILAGYSREMDEFINSNPGLRSRFNRTMTFTSLNPTQCIQLLVRVMQKQELDVSALGIIKEGSHEGLFEHFAILSSLKGWGNARDIHTLGTRIYRMALSAADDNDVLAVTPDQIGVALQEMITSRGGQLPKAPPPGWSGREWLERRGYK
ncbi:P-loop containing nucleoside triphosphate hydrolase protein [Penicillium canescens]|nr:P-loop containing nucleoside triphosphate hydrolase protein [Penicillium canescens]